MEVVDPPPVYGDVAAFSAVFQLLIDVAKQRHLNLVIDEVQEFVRITPPVDRPNLVTVHRVAQISRLRNYASRPVAAFVAHKQLERQAGNLLAPPAP